MELPKILEILKEPERIIDPNQCNMIASYLSGFIMDAEEELYTLSLAVSSEWLTIREASKSSVEADRKSEVTPLNQKREKVRMKIGQLKRLRSDLKDRFQVLTNIKHY